MGRSGATGRSEAAEGRNKGTASIVVGMGSLFLRGWAGKDHIESGKVYIVPVMVASGYSDSFRCSVWPITAHYVKTGLLALGVMSRRAGRIKDRYKAKVRPGSALDAVTGACGIICGQLVRHGRGEPNSQSIKARAFAAIH